MNNKIKLGEEDSEMGRERNWRKRCILCSPQPLLFLRKKQIPGSARLNGYCVILQLLLKKSALCYEMDGKGLGIIP